ncbi:hypothetical protein [Planctomyces sp. SH-PL62]|uniref:hypothetical protein n=1 Tax=Planctomyces sp. SH-PL62 TaxID=1636152 RepID=UPI00078D0249|nr:hypothetical protein [Planctomyces sp. SH-PL62]AMV38989.1 hypothetical protein VT85_16250 [Planctomyces sp. SH-PL62]
MEPNRTFRHPDLHNPADASSPPGLRPRRFNGEPRRGACVAWTLDSVGTGGTSRGVWVLVAMGLVVRLLRYAQGLPFWSDECFLAVNFIQRGYLELTKPLDNGQICPLLFLWIERTAVACLGFSEWSLRLFPLLCGLASVVLFERVARLFVRGLPLLAAVGIFAVSVHPIRHAAEAKPYASDLLAALVLLGPAAAWLAERDRSWWLWVLLMILPPALALSNPAVFAAGGLLIALAWPVWRSGRWADRTAFVCCALMLGGLFLTFHVGFGGIQGAAAMDGLRRYWEPGFPPFDAPTSLPGWLLSAMTGSLFAYPGGGARGASAATFLACLVGAATLWRRGRGAAVIALTAPLGLNLIAAALERYPFGPEARLAQFAAPGICILAGAGFSRLVAAVRRPTPRAILLYAGLVGLVACAFAPQVVSWRRPYRMPHDREAREFARRFWPDLGQDAVAACAHLDYRIDRPGSWQGRRAWYLCNQAVYSPERRDFGGPRLEEVSEDRPLRCVVFDEEPSDPKVAAWLARMRSDYHLRSARSVQAHSTFGDAPRPLVETYWIYEFTPLPSRTASPPTMNGDLSG